MQMGIKEQYTVKGQQGLNFHFFVINHQRNKWSKLKRLEEIKKSIKNILNHLQQI